jgi:hypothetical protein
MTRLVIINGVQEGRVLRLRSGINRIGRSVENHLQVPDPSVSSAHCEIIFADAEILVRDLQSTNGTLIDGEPIHEGRIRIGQMLQIGNIQMSVQAPELTSEDAGVSVPDIAPPSVPASAVLADGTVSCVNHTEIRAEYCCTACQQAFCEVCVRIIKRVSGKGILVFCPLCAAACQVVEPPVGTAASATPLSSFFHRLTKTLKLPFRKGAR